MTLIYIKLYFSNNYLSKMIINNKIIAIKLGKSKNLWYFSIVINNNETAIT